jgi:hypothetical protein
MQPLAQQPPAEDPGSTTNAGGVKMQPNNPGRGWPCRDLMDGIIGLEEHVTTSGA